MGVLTSCPSLKVVYIEGKKMYTRSNGNFRFYILGLDYSLFSEIVMVLSSGLVSPNLPFLENQEEILIRLAILGLFIVVILFCNSIL